MKLSLMVMTSGKAAGKVIPIPVSKFLVGRDPDCQLRPASSLVSKRHCGIHVRGGKVFVEDYQSTNGTFVNNGMIMGEVELHDHDLLKIGPLQFEVRLETSTPVSKPTPLPATRRGAPVADEEAAALLLSPDEGGPTPGSPNLDSQGVPTGSTVFETGALGEPSINGSGEATRTEITTAPGKIDDKSGDKSGDKSSDKPAEKSADKAPKTEQKPKASDTSVVAQAILEKYLRRPRTVEDKKK